MKRKKFESKHVEIVTSSFNLIIKIQQIPEKELNGTIIHMS